MKRQEVPVTYTDFFEAHDATSKLRAMAGEGVVVRVEPSRYGRGYIVRQFPVEILIDPD